MGQHPQPPPPDGIQVRRLRPDEAALLERVADDVFDDPVVPASAAAFLADPRHHLVVALDGQAIVGFVSAVHYLHPDKAGPELWLNEVGVAESHRGRGLGRRLMAAALDLGRELGCGVAWVLTERDNAPAMRLYGGAGGREHPPDTVMFEFDLAGEVDADPAAASV